MQIQTMALASDETRTHPWSDIQDGPETLILVFGHEARPPVGLLKYLRNAFPKAAIAGASVAGHIPDGVPPHKTHVVAIRLEGGGFWAVTTDEATSHDGHPATAALAHKILNAVPGSPTRAAYLLGAPFRRSVGDVAAEGLRLVLGESLPTIGCVSADSEATPGKGWILDRDGIHTDGIVAVTAHGPVIARAGSRCGATVSKKDAPLLVDTAQDGRVSRINGMAALDALVAALDGQRWNPEDARERLLHVTFALGRVLPDGEPLILRTVQDVSHSSGAVLFAGDVPPGSVLRLAKMTPDSMATAVDALCTDLSQSGRPGVMLAVSCAARICEKVPAYPLPRGSRIVGLYGAAELCPRPRLLHENHFFAGLWIEEATGA